MFPKQTKIRESWFSSTEKALNIICNTVTNYSNVFDVKLEVTASIFESSIMNNLNI